MKKLSTFKCGEISVNLYDTIALLIVQVECKGVKVPDYYNEWITIDAAVKDFAERVQIVLSGRMHDLYR